MSFVGLDKQDQEVFHQIFSKRLKGGCEVVSCCYQFGTVMVNWMTGEKSVSLMY